VNLSALGFNCGSDLCDGVAIGDIKSVAVEQAAASLSCKGIEVFLPTGTDRDIMAIACQFTGKTCSNATARASDPDATVAWRLHGHWDQAPADAASAIKDS
jgi:hypothetical protein